MAEKEVGMIVFEKDMGQQVKLIIIRTVNGTVINRMQNDNPPKQHVENFINSFELLTSVNEQRRHRIRRKM